MAPRELDSPYLSTEEGDKQLFLSEGMPWPNGTRWIETLTHHNSSGIMPAPVKTSLSNVH